MHSHIQHLLNISDSQNSTSTGSAEYPSSVDNISPLLLRLGIAVGGVIVLTMLSRFACRRMDAARQIPELGSSAVNDPSAPLVARSRSCWSRLFWAETTGKGACRDLGESVYEGVRGTFECGSAIFSCLAGR